MASVIHEYDAFKNHRIVVIDQNEKRTEGKWTPHNQIAQHKGYYAATDCFGGQLPEGVFRMNWVPHTKQQPH